MKRTKIVATYGPSVARPALVKELVRAGVNAIRVNCAHGGTRDFLTAARIIREGCKGAAWPVGLLFDIAGPKLRVDRFDGRVDVSRGKKITLRVGRSEPSRGILSVNQKQVISALKRGNRVYIDDGSLIFDVVQAGRGQVVLKAQNSGTILPGKGINLPDSRVKLPTIGDKDAEDIKTAVRIDADFIALSFVRSAADIGEARRLLKKLGGRQQIIAKLEKREAIDDLDNIMKAADGVMIARGDLGVELPPAEVPRLQRRVVRLANCHHKPVIVATQMLESMRTNPRATRAEINDVATAVFEYADAVMLSAETATGSYPVEAVQTMNEVCETTEAALSGWLFDTGEHLVKSSIPLAIGEGVRKAVETVESECVFAFTTSGFTASLISNLHPMQTVIAMTGDRKVMTALSLCRAVYPILAEQPKSFDELLRLVNQTARKHKLARKGENVIVTGGVPFGSTTYTNFMMIHRVS